MYPSFMCSGKFWIPVLLLSVISLVFVAGCGEITTENPEQVTIKLTSGKEIAFETSVDNWTIDTYQNYFSWVTTYRDTVCDTFDYVETWKVLHMIPYTSIEIIKFTYGREMEGN